MEGMEWMEGGAGPLDPPSGYAPAETSKGNLCILTIFSLFCALIPSVWNHVVDEEYSTKWNLAQNNVFLHVNI